MARTATPKKSGQRTLKAVKSPRGVPDGVIDAEAENTLHAAEKVLTSAELKKIKSSRDFFKILRTKKFGIEKFERAFEYENQLRKLQIELVKMQRWAADTQQRVAIIFEGRDAAGKGGTIRRFVEHMNPRALRVVALPKPTEDETGQWYFQRYARQLPNQGEIVFFDRSWYNRAVVEPVNEFCDQAQYDQFMRQVPEFEHMLYEDGVRIIKFWFSIDKEEQQRRFDSRRVNPLKQWKLSPVDQRAQDLWSEYSEYKEQMFSRTHTSFSPWIIIKANNKKSARLESIRYVLSQFDYAGKDDAETSLHPDPNVVLRYHRSVVNYD